MSYASPTTGATQSRPLGMTIIILLNALFTLIGYFFSIGILIFGIGSLGLGIDGGLMIIVATFLLLTALTAAYMLLLYGLYTLNTIAYYIFFGLTLLSVFINLIGLNILGLIIQGLIFGYILTVRDVYTY